MGLNHCLFHRPRKCRTTVPFAIDGAVRAVWGMVWSEGEVLGLYVLCTAPRAWDRPQGAIRCIAFLVLSEDHGQKGLGQAEPTPPLALLISSRAHSCVLAEVLQIVGSQLRIAAPWASHLPTRAFVLLMSLEVFLLEWP